MNEDYEISVLERRFEALGATDPRSWAESQVREGIPQLVRYLFLRQAWSRIVDESDPTWIDSWIAAAEQRPDDPFSGGGIALKRLRALGATPSDLTDLVRAFQADLLFSICYLLDDPSIEDEEAKDVLWSLVQVSPDGEVIARLGSLHESVLDTDPTGREMRPNR